MNADAHPVLKLFENKIRLEVPLFQRKYVWDEEHQWEPLWEDIERKFLEKLNPELERTEAPPHFLGAMVLDQKQTPTTHVEKRLIIDGQQRLITIQIFLAAYRDFCNECKAVEVAEECNRYVTNPGNVKANEEEKFKVWPTQLDRNVFKSIMKAGSKIIVEESFPLLYHKYARKPERRPLMVEAYLYFYQQIHDLFMGTDEGKYQSSDVPLDKRLDSCLLVLEQALQVVVIDLGKEDDAQIIFETLNARGEPLLPADLLRNFIFLRASRNNESSDELYSTYWRKFDDDFWRTEIRQGRLMRPRSDLFLQHFLSSTLATDIPVKHLYVEYKYWIESKKPFSNVKNELQLLTKQRDFYRRLIETSVGDKLYRLSSFLISFDMSTVYPLLLYLNENEFPKEEWNVVSTAIESFLLRRVVCGLSTKNYNQIFLGIVRSLEKERDNRKRELSVNMIIDYLSGSSGSASKWPSDEDFRNSWLTRDLYNGLDNRKLVWILMRLNETYLNNMSESIIINGPLTIEHILPQKWLEKWPLQGGLKGMDLNELTNSADGDQRAELTRLRNAKLQTMGNLTLLTQPLNASQSNDSWEFKKPKMLESSLLPINQQLYSYDVWDETQIQQRGETLYKKAKMIWPAADRIKIET